jgi:hypothetical protein
MNKNKFRLFVVLINFLIMFKLGDLSSSRGVEVEDNTHILLKGLIQSLT